MLQHFKTKTTLYEKQQQQQMNDDIRALHGVLSENMGLNTLMSKQFKCVLLNLKINVKKKKRPDIKCIVN